MRKMIRCLMICVFAAAIIGIAGLLADKQELKNSLIRFHVIANSNGEEDQNVKLLVKDAVIQSIQEDMAAVADVDQARYYLQENLPKIQSVANAVLKAAGFEETAVVSLCQEQFSARDYETFSLPAGIYEALRIVIGEGEGENWWCVAFPSLCLPETIEAFSDTAQEAGLSDDLTKTIQTDASYQIRFFLLDMIGRIENSMFHR